MSGVHRFLSRLEKKQTQSRPHQKAGKKPDHFGGIFITDRDYEFLKKPDKEHERNIATLLQRLKYNGIDTMVESNVEYALRASNGDTEAAYRLLVLLQETYEGIVRPYHAETKLLGAVNREAVTCFLDALLFAMFARLDSFEAMLYDSFEDLPRKKLAGLLRLWVNMLRSGRLITTDITAYLQAALADCGWQDAATLKQQDPSEAFTFITGQLELPLLTLKMDLYHTGKEDAQDDHKFVHERLLEVAILDEPPEGRGVITLEDCLEHYFNNRIEVKRHLENRRRNTNKSVDSADSAAPETEKEPGTHIEVVEMPETPLLRNTIADSPSQSTTKDPLEKLRPTAGRKRADSIFSQRKVELTGIDPEALKAGTVDENAVRDAKDRKLSTRTEVLMPAWQFFKLLPWYTDHLPTSDAQVAAHFSRKRPVLGICLKRYSYSNTGQARRNGTYIDIPLEIGVPNFVSDDAMQDDGPLVGNFRLLLQSVVCHRGVSVDSGHYVTLCRGRAANAQNVQHRAGQTQSENGDTSDSDDAEDSWMRFDDLAKERVSYVDIRQALKQETPYLLFYQVQPIDDDGRSIHDLPSYEEATSRAPSDAQTLEKPYLNEPPGSEDALTHVDSSHQSETSEVVGTKLEATDFAVGSGRTSLDVTRVLDGTPRGRTSFNESRRQSIAFEESSSAGSTSGGSTRADTAMRCVPSTAAEERTGGFLSVASKFGSKRGSRVSESKRSRSRPSSAGPETNGNRLSFSMIKLTQRMSRNDSGGTAPVPAIPPLEAVTAELAGQTDAQNGQQKALGLAWRENPSKESVTTTKPLPRPAMTPTPKGKAAIKREKRKSRGQHEDRDCRLM